MEVLIWFFLPFIVPSVCIVWKILFQVKKIGYDIKSIERRMARLEERIDALLETDKLAGTNLTNVNLNGTFLAYKKVSEELQEENQELIERVKRLEAQLERQNSAGHSIEGIKETAYKGCIIRTMESGGWWDWKIDTQYTGLTIYLDSTPFVNEDAAIKHAKDKIDQAIRRKW
jgi:hypothetical protein